MDTIRFTSLWSCLAVAVGCTEPNPNSREHCGAPVCDGEATASSSEGEGTTSEPFDPFSRTSGDGSNPGETGIGDADPTGTGEEASETGSASADESTDGSTGPEPPACDNGRMCVDGPPEGWAGPVALRHLADGEAPTCGDGYDQLELTAGTSVTASDATCGCTCARETNATCRTSVDVRDWGANSSCQHTGSPDDIVQLPPGGLVTTTQPLSLSRTGGSHWRVPGVSPVDPGSCSGTGSVDSLDTAALADRVSLCAAAEPTSDGCDATEQCLTPPAAPLDAPLCIWQRGDLDCPETGVYQTRSVYYDEIADDRGCTECTCRALSSTCNRTVTFSLRSNLNSTTASQATPTNSTWCGIVGDSNQTVTRASLSVAAINGSCVANPYGPTGDASPTSPLTVCCAG